MIIFDVSLPVTLGREGLVTEGTGGEAPMVVLDMSHAVTLRRKDLVTVSTGREGGAG